MTLRPIIPVLAFVAVAGIPAVAADNAPDDSQQAARGAQVYADQCWRCHNGYVPGPRSDQAWRAVILHMRVEAILSRSEQQALLAYVRQRSGSPPPAGHSGG
jgi:mono/diheme cytochrome c family protein